MADFDARLERKIERIFDAADRSEALRLLRDECTFHQPGLRRESPGELTRVRTALLKISNGSLQRLRQYAGSDWRDLLVWSGLGAGDVWERWLEDDA